MAEVDWREMFRRYVAIVRREEGVDFLHGPADGYDDWTADEWAAIRVLIGGALRCDNCGKTMAEHDALAHCWGPESKTYSRYDAP